MKRVLRIALRISVMGLAVYVGIVVFFVVCEPMLVYPAPPATLGDWEAARYDAEEVRLTTSDATELQGWYFEHPEPQAYVLFCHGNGEHLGFLGDWADELRRRHRVSLLVFDYRGYGNSEGRPHEAGLLRDGDAALRWLAERSGKPPEQMVLYGRSLGGAVATHLAAEHGARGVILERTFPSMVDVAAEFYPWLPVRLMMRNRYRSIEKIASYDGPLLQMHGADDEIVPVALAERFFDVAPSEEKRFLVMPGIGHNDPTRPEFERAMGEFIRSLPDRD